LNIKDRVCRVSLGKDNLTVAKFKDRFSFAYLGKKFLGIKSLIDLVWHVPNGPCGEARLSHQFSDVHSETTPARGANWGRIHRMTLGKGIRQCITK
jgi:hypothetical protein